MRQRMIGGNMNKTSMVLARTAGSVAGLLVGGGLLGGGLMGLQKALFRDSGGGVEETAGRFAVNMVPFFVIGGIVGAAAGATVVQKALRQTGSFWKALLGSFVGLLVGTVVSLPLLFLFIWLVGEAGELVLVVIVPAGVVAGAVIGSGWKGKAPEAVVH
jgi:hypothetical protein